MVQNVLMVHSRVEENFDEYQSSLYYTHSTHLPNTRLQEAGICVQMPYAFPLTRHKQTLKY